MTSERVERALKSYYDLANSMSCHCGNDGYICDAHRHRQLSQDAIEELEQERASLLPQLGEAATTEKAARLERELWCLKAALRKTISDGLPDAIRGITQSFIDMLNEALRRAAKKGAV